MEEQIISHSRRKRRQKTYTKGAQAILWLNRFQGAVILLLTGAAPWLFGCTEKWSVRFMNGGVLAIVLLEVLIRFLDPKTHKTSSVAIGSGFPKLLFGFNVLFLAYCVIALLNARASFSIETQEFTYNEGVIAWLPTTYDKSRTLQFIVDAMAFFFFFWCVRAWLHRTSDSSTSEKQLEIGRGARVLLWFFVTNGFLVALQGLLQRFSHSSKLLWFRPSYWETVDGCFGPFSYRGNAADYLNLVWPVTFGLWYVLARGRGRHRFRIGDGPELLLLPMSLVTAAASFATLSRGGAIVAAAMLCVFGFVLLRAKISRGLKISLGVMIATVLIAASLLSGNLLATRFRTALSDNLSGRTEIYENARQIAADFPWFGTGPGTFLSVYHLYRANPDQGWAAFLHDDWLETRITFGRVGFAIVLIQLGLLLFWTFRRRQFWVSPVLTLSLLIALGGCLVHAKRDFPFQTYGVIFTFVLVCSLLTSSFSTTLKGHTPSDFP